jgi:hypothetical protein
VARRRASVSLKFEAATAKALAAFLFFLTTNPRGASMRWTFQITAASRPRVLMRLVQVFDQQSLVIRSLELVLLDNRVKINLTTEVEPELARRLQAKLYHQVDIEDVELRAG